MPLMFLRVGNDLISLEEIAAIKMQPVGEDNPPSVSVALKSDPSRRFVYQGDSAAALIYYFNDVLPGLNPAVIENAQGYYDDKPSVDALLANLKKSRENAGGAPVPPTSDKKPRLLIIPKKEPNVGQQNVPAHWDEGGV